MDKARRKRKPARITSGAARRAVADGGRGNVPPENVVRGGKYYSGKGAVLEPGPHVFRECFPWVFDKTEATASGGDRIKTSTALRRLSESFRRAHDAGGRVWFIGNGGSAAIASHLAVDFTKNGGVRAMAMNDAATLTCLSNDFGYDNVFGRQLAYQATTRDGVVIISTSGRSLNILSAARTARLIGCAFVGTLSGMNPNNVLRQLGDVNLYVPSTSYGIVETSHLILLHSLMSA